MPNYLGFDFLEDTAHNPMFVIVTLTSVKWRAI